MNLALRFLIYKLIEIYQVFFSFDRGLLMFLAPGGACRYEVTCSEYMKIQVRDVGVVRGIGLGVRRIISCR